MYRNHIFLFVLLSFLFVTLNAQVLQRTGSIFSAISNKIATMPGINGDEYSEPDSAQLNTWKNTLTKMFQGNYSSASDSANFIGYQLVQFTDTLATPFHTYYF